MQHRQLESTQICRAVWALLRGPMPNATYQRTLQIFGEQRTAEIAFLVGYYCLLASILNMYNGALPSQGDTPS